ncbi:hypothetical protein G6F56_012897 [Rhizopus delemar]|nr:hypothetical protein G6F56_012897 [Rhizopus delemar]
MSSSQKYTYSDLTDEVHELNDLYKDMQEDNREMNARIISLQQEVRNLTHVIEEHQKVNDDVRNLLNYMSVQGSRNIETNTNDEVIQSGERIIPMDVPKTPASLLGRRTRAGDAKQQDRKMETGLCKDADEKPEQVNSLSMSTAVQRY